jgi:hypothetical protein
MANLFHAQNLVPNWSYEDTLQCPSSGGQIHLAHPWFQPCIYDGTIFNSSSTDLFSPCSFSTLVGIPSNVVGFEFPKSGNGYAGFILNNDTSNVVEYMEVSLLDSLVSGREYCISFYVSLAEESKKAISSIGAFFSIDSLLDNTFYNAIDYCIPQFESSYNIHLNNKNDWMLISGSFTATGGEKFLTIGNFKKPIDTNIQTLSSGTLPFAYYYIDDVSVMDCNDTLSSVNEINQQYDVILYPNPNNGTFTIECSAFETGKAILNIYDVTGKKIAEHLVNSKNKTLTINENSLDAGVYYYQIMVNDKTMKSDKLVIIK